MNDPDAHTNSQRLWQFAQDLNRFKPAEREKWAWATAPNKDKDTICNR